MRVIIHNINDINLDYIKEALEYAKELEEGLKEGSLSRLTVTLEDRVIYYTLWHNKKSITITSQEVINENNPI